MTAAPQATTDAQALLALAERVEKAGGSDRELELAIHIALYPNSDIAKVAKHRRGLDHEEGTAWEIWHSGSVVVEQYRNGQCIYNGGYPLPAVTGSIDAAMTLVPEGAQWTLEKDAAWIRWMGNVDVEEVQSVLLQRNGTCTAPALLAAALRARAAQMEGK